MNLTNGDVMSGCEEQIKSETSRQIESECINGYEQNQNQGSRYFIMSTLTNVDKKYLAQKNLTLLKLAY